MRSMGYDFVRVGGRRHLVCAKCRHPLLKGHNPPYQLPEPGVPILPELCKQSVCGECFKEMYAFFYPDSEVPDVFDGRLPDTLPVPWGEQAAPIVEGQMSDFDKWEQAVLEARASNGAEKVEQAFHRLWISEGPETTMTMVEIEEAQSPAA